jgi:hypothetical protein
VWKWQCYTSGVSKALEEMPPLGGPPVEPYETQSEGLYETREAAEHAAKQSVSLDPKHNESTEIRLLELKPALMQIDEPTKRAAKKKTTKKRKKRKKTAKKKDNKK